MPSIVTLSMGESGAEDKPKRGRWQRRNLLWADEFEYFDYTGWTIVAHNSSGGGRVCREEVLQKRECFTSNRLETIVGVELLST